MPSLRPSVASALLLVSCAQALQITPGSSCSSVCGDTSTTASSDIVCSDFDYYSSDTGSTFMSCMECLQTSNSTSDSQSDIAWFLYNLRYASAVCIYDFPTHNTSNSTSSATSTASALSCDLEYACAPLQGALEYGNLSPSDETEFGYCSAADSAFYGSSINDCVSCLQSSPSTYTANFLMALEAGCQQEPAAGSLLAFTGSLFSTTAIKITVSSNATSSTSSSDEPVLSTNDVIAIVCGLGGLFLLATGLFGLYIARQRRYAREDAMIHASTYTPRHHRFFYGGGGPGSYCTDQTYALPHYTVDHKSQLATADPFGSSPEPQPKPSFDQKNDYHSNADYYDDLEGRFHSQPLQAHPVKLANAAPSIVSSLVSEADAAGGVPMDALPAHPAYIQRGTTPGHLGGRASRSASRSTSVRSRSQSHQPQGRASSSTDQSLFRSQSHSNTSSAHDSTEIYTMQSFPSVIDQGSNNIRSHGFHHPQSGRNAQVMLASPEEAHMSQGRDARPLPPSSQVWLTTSTSAHSPPLASAANFDYGGMAPPERIAYASASHPAVTRPSPSRSSLILSAVPKIRIPGKNSTRKGVAGRQIPHVRTAGDTPSMAISRPLAFPDSRFTVRPSNDRIIEQTVNFKQLHTEVPIGSGKSLLYG